MAIYSLRKFAPFWQDHNSTCTVGPITVLPARHLNQMQITRKKRPLSIESMIQKSVWKLFPMTITFNSFMALLLMM